MSSTTKVKEEAVVVEEIDENGDVVLGTPDAVFSEYLTMAHLTYQMEVKKRVSLGEFAEKLDISGGLLSHYMKGIRKPRKATVDKMAVILGEEIYTVLGMPIPDPIITEIDRLLGTYTSEEREEVLDFMHSM